MSKKTGEPQTVTITPRRFLTRLEISKDPDSDQVWIGSVFTEAATDPQGAPVRLIREVRRETSAAKLIACGIIKDERIQALYTEISTTMHKFADLEEGGQ